jgi:tripartite-type tricarboxylate transporter receptor subunit TctC
MGTPATEVNRYKGEDPLHRATIARPFAVARFAITFDQWDTCLADGDCNDDKGDDHGFGRGRMPAQGISFEAAKSYLAWLSRKVGRTYRLPSETEREYFARAGTSTPFWFRKTISQQDANYQAGTPYANGPRGVNSKGPAVVDSYPPNPFGLYQVHGNVMEWTEDCLNKRYTEDTPTDGAPWLEGDCTKRMTRGGLWGWSADKSRAGRRDDAHIGSGVSFRVVRTLAAIKWAIGCNQNMVSQEDAMEVRRLRSFTPGLLSLVLIFASLQAAIAQSFPDKPIRLVVPFAAGGPADALGRILGEKLSQRWDQPVVIENRGGAGSTIGATAVARAAPDGYTLLLNASSHVINASLTQNLAYDPIKDFTPISELASYMLVLVVHPSVQATTLKDFVEVARSHPNGLTVANAGSGTPTHLAAVLFAQTAGLNFVHVSYRGAAPATNDLLAGHALAMFNNPVNAVPQAKAKSLRAIAVTGSKRLSLLPDLPTIAESGYPGFETRTWYGLFGPAGLPPELVAKLFTDMHWALYSSDVSEKLVAQGWDILGSEPADFTVVLQAELDKWSTVVKSANIKEN